MRLLTLTNAILPSGERADVHIANDEILEVVVHGHRSNGRAVKTAGTSSEVDLDGFLLLPAPAEPHSHFDKILTSRFLESRSGDLEGAVAAWYGYRDKAGVDEIQERAAEGAEMLLMNGATAVRTHIDVGESVGLRFIEATVALRERLSHVLDLQIVAFVDNPIAGEAGSKNRDLLCEALDAGADVVGGAPYRDADPARSQRMLLEIAERYGRPADLHTDETLDAGVLWVERLPGLVRKLGLNGRVAASHCVSLGMQPPHVSAVVACDIAEAGVAVITCPATNLYLQGRDREQAVPRGLTALNQLRAADALIAAGGDNIQDPFYPIGSGDPLETAALLVSAGHFSAEAAYEAVSNGARRAMGLPEIRLERGSAAELLAVRATSTREAIARRATSRIVIRRGAIIARTDVTRSMMTELSQR